MSNRIPKPKVLQCTCRNAGRCGYCPSIAITATRQAKLPAGSPGQVAADRIARRHR